MRVLSVTGYGSEPVQASRVQVQLGVQVQERNAGTVQQRVAERSTALIELLRSQAVENLQTTGISLEPRYDFDTRPPRLIGYVGENRLQFETTVDQVGALLDEAVASGATRIIGISFAAEEAAIATAREAALQAATADAQAQATVVLASLKLSPEEVVEIRVGNAEPFFQERSAAFSASESARVETPVVAGEQVVRAAVTLYIRY